MKRIFLFFPVFILLGTVHAQIGDSVNGKSLEDCIKYALDHQTNIRQSLIDEQITEREIKIRLSDWYPQLNFSGNYQNNFQRPVSIFTNGAQSIGTYNASGGYFILNQTIFNRDVLLASQSKKDVRLSSRQNTVNTRIAVVSNVSKAFYDLLLSTQQISLLDTDIVLLERSLKDAYNQYKGGLVDKTDYQRATITLNNTKASRITASETLKIRASVLKLYMSYPVDSVLLVTYDSAKMIQEVTSFDTLQQVDLNKRIEYQQLLTEKRLEQENLKYYKWGFLPTLSAYGQYNLNYYNNQFKDLFQTNYPNSYAGLTLTLPLFTGTRHIQEVKVAKLQLERLDYNFISLKDSINTQFVEALSSYKSNLSNYYAQKENLDLAHQVYNIIQLQYRAGIKTYLDVVIANIDLFSAQVNYVNAMYQVLSNRIDVERALGTLKYNY
ncbi:MAG: TolC family protein [Bacteroidota bacterium]|nr:TolC family protein [Bacteroidota bacterium]